MDRVAKKWEAELCRDIRHTCKIVPRKVYGRFLLSQWPIEASFLHLSEKINKHVVVNFRPLSLFLLLFESFLQTILTSRNTLSLVQAPDIDIPPCGAAAKQSYQMLSSSCSWWMFRPLKLFLSLCTSLSSSKEWSILFFLLNLYRRWPATYPMIIISIF